MITKLELYRPVSPAVTVEEPERLKTGETTRIRTGERDPAQSEAYRFTSRLAIGSNVFIGTLPDGRIAALHSWGDGLYGFYISEEAKSFMPS